MKGAPEKVYFNPLLMENGESIVRVRTFERLSDSQIEYTRTDAFIEKAAEWLDGVIWAYLDLDYISDFTILRNVDNEKFIEDFKNYMKGK